MRPMLHAGVVSPLAFGSWLLLGLLARPPLSGLVPFMPDALQLHLMRGLELGQVLWIAGWGVHVVECMLQHKKV